jgi:hypothetical protein
MKTSRSAFFFLTAALIFVPTWAKATTPINTLTSATGATNFDNANYTQHWTWNTQNGGGLVLSSTGSTNLSGAGLLVVSMSGTASGTNVPGAGISVSNSFAGTNTTAEGLYASASSGTAHNYGVYGQALSSNAGDAGVWGDDGGGGTLASYGVYGTSESPAGYGGYFKNSAGGYAAAFIGGNVGIGTATPVNLLDIGTSGGIHIASGVPVGTSMALYNNSGTLTWNGTALATGSSVSGTTNYIPVFTGASSLGNSVINQSGSNVGIGTANPITPFDLHLATDQNILFDPSGITPGYPAIQSINDAYNANGPLSFIGNPTEFAGGNVGIGTPLPAYTLQVNGSVAGTSAYVNTSDVRRKKNIQPLDVGLKEIEQLRPVSFEWKDDILNQSIKGKTVHHPLEFSMQGKQIGLVAQDVEKVLPSVVVTEPSADKMKGMKYSELIPVLVKAIQEQQAEIDELKKQIRH